MPCEGCQVQFTVFRRKRSCSECRRYYCNNCLSSTKRGNGAGHSLLLCQRCAIFAKRPLLRSDLLQLKPKDLIFYLQSKHISTAGCVEKDELVCLVLNHAQQVDAHRLNGHGQGGTDHSHHGRASADTTNSFDSIKQTCQNFFTNISDNLTESFTNLDGRDNANKQQQQQSQRHAPYNNGERHGGPTVEQQPVRVHTREIPTYASYQREQQRTNSSQTQPQQPQMPTQTNNLPAAPSTTTTRTTKSPTEHSTRTAESLAGTTTTSHLANTNTTTPTNTSSSPTYSVSTVSSARVQNDIDLNDEVASTSTLSTASKRNDDGEHNKSDCECSDDEMIADFSARQSLKTDTATSQRLTPEQQQERTTTRERDVVGGGPSTSNASTTNYSKVGGGGSTFSSKVDVCDVSSQSSFEELAAIGGISDESRPTTETTNSSVNMEQWMMLEVPTTANESSSSEQMADVEQNNEDRKLAIKTQRSDLPKLRLNQQQPPQRKPKVQRRRSDSYLNRRHNELLTPTSPTARNLPITNLNQSALSGLAVEEHEMHPCEVEPSTSRRRQSCTRCGKNKTNLRHQVEKMRRHLESAQMSDEDIKREIKEFLEYLEMRTKSMDHSDSETVGSSMSAAANLTQVATMVQTPSPMDDNDGIHVYASTSSYDGGESRFINLEDFDNMDDLECLTVKQLKEILMLHRVDYKGCCEKQELLERVERLWKNLKTTPAVEKLPTDELCKICMDAPIECVILECGHMATCTNCGKVLSECPICRQYIVRVVRFFRA